MDIPPRKCIYDEILLGTGDVVALLKRRGYNISDISIEAISVLEVVTYNNGILCYHK